MSKSHVEKGKDVVVKLCGLISETRNHMWLHCWSDVPGMIGLSDTSDSEQGSLGIYPYEEEIVG